jgi:UDP-3-O-[3-hydroxymyristoyl] glucosamine N-acyltransferase
VADTRFYRRAGPFALGDLLQNAPAHQRQGGDDILIEDVAPLDRAGERHISFLTHDKRYQAVAQASQAAVIIAAPQAADWVEGAQLIVSDAPQRLFNYVVGQIYPDSAAASIETGPADSNRHPTARVDQSAMIAPTAIIGEGVEIGAGTQIGHYCVIGRGVQIGRDCRIEAHVSINYALLGDDVRLASGVRIGTTGFGLIEGETHERVHHIGRVIIQSHVDIGSNTTVDRGTYGDTVLGEGAKIDNLVQIAHNVQIGRHARLAGTVGLAGSCVIKDYAVLGGGVGVGNGVEIGAHAVIAGRSVVFRTVPDGEFYAGYPARPLKDWQKQQAFISRLQRQKSKGKGQDNE